MILFKILLKEYRAICPDLVVGVPAYLQHKSHHLAVFVDRSLPTLHHQRKEESVAQLAPCERALAISELLDSFQCYKLYVCKVDLPDNLIEHLAPAFFEHLIFIEFIGGNLDSELEQALLIVSV